MMLQWVGLCWYYFWYLDLSNEEWFVDFVIEKYWMIDFVGGVGGVDFYVGGVEYVVLYLFYVCFWYKVFYDFNYVLGLEFF